MRSTRKELNVDFIGDQQPLTAAETAAISKYLQSKKKQRQAKRTKSDLKKSKTSTISD